MTEQTSITWPESIWAATAPPPPDCPALDGPLDVDAVVIGAGFTGLSTALHLARDGVEVAVVEAMAPGWGASGRNNGQVIPTLTRPEPDDIAARFGVVGERFVAILRDCADELFALVREHDLAAEAEQTGWVQPVHSPGRIRIAERRVAQWAHRGAPVELLSRDAIIAKTGSEFWYGGWWNPTGGHINPLALTREMARVAIASGARIYGRTPATSIARDGDDWVVVTPRGTVRGHRLMVASNAYSHEFSSALMPDVARQVVPVLSWQMATRPVGDNLRTRIIPGRQAISDTQGDLHFMRYDARNRLVTGGALMVKVNARSRLEQRLGARLQRIFPELGDVAFDYLWNGYVGMTSDFMPRFHRLGPRGYAWVGCNGRGVGLSVALGRRFAQALQGAAPGELGLPLTDPKPLPAHGALRLLAPLRLIEYRWRDGREV